MFIVKLLQIKMKIIGNNQKELRGLFLNTRLSFSSQLLESKAEHL